MRTLVVVGLGFGVTRDRIGKPEFCLVEDVLVYDSLGANLGGRAGKERCKAGRRFDLHKIAGLLVAVVIHAVRLIQKVALHQVNQGFGAVVVTFDIVCESEVLGDLSHRAQLAHQVKGQIDTFDRE